MTTTTQTSTGSSAMTPPRISHDDYKPMLDLIKAQFRAAAESPHPLFTTDATGLWDLYLRWLPEDERQGHNCHACRRFVEAYGGLVTIDDHGRVLPAMWDHGGVGIYAEAFAELSMHVRKARITGVFLTSISTLGLPTNRDRKRGTSWNHMSVNVPGLRLFKETALKTASQAMAERLEDRGILARGIAEFSLNTVNQALAIVEADALYRGEKVAGPLRWLASLMTSIHAQKNARVNDALIWRAVATAPAGWCHVKSSMTGTLLEDIEAGLGVEDVKRKFAAKMHPLQYMRPTAAPSAGAIAQGNKVVEALGTAGALRRRFARIDDIHPVWLPQPAQAPTGDEGTGVFDHLLKRETGRVYGSVIKAPAMTWDKFQRTVLPEAVSMEIYVPHEGAFISLVTAVDPLAPPIIQWDRDGHRNPASWYVYARGYGTTAAGWGLSAHSWAKVNAITLLPFMWPGAIDHGNHGAGAIFIIDGARDKTEPTACIFPEILKSEYHAVRSVIEAYSQGAKLEGRENASASGLVIRKGTSSRPVTVRVTGKTGAVTEYMLDRWD